MRVSDVSLNREFLEKLLGADPEKVKKRLERELAKRQMLKDELFKTELVIRHIYAAIGKPRPRTVNERVQKHRAKKSKM